MAYTVIHQACDMRRMMMSKMMCRLVMFTLVLLAMPLAAKDWFTFRFNPDYTIKYPSNWELTDRKPETFTSKSMSLAPMVITPRSGSKAIS